MGVYRAPLPFPEKICQIIITSAAGKATMPPKINAIASPSPLNIVVLPTLFPCRAVRFRCLRKADVSGNGAGLLHVQAME